MTRSVSQYLGGSKLTGAGLTDLDALLRNFEALLGSQIFASPVPPLDFFTSSVLQLVQTHTYADLSIVSATNKVTSATALVAGEILLVTAGTGFTADHYKILSVDGSNVATLDAAVGTVGSTAGAARSYTDPFPGVNTGDNHGQVYQPQIVSVPGGWNGYRFWMAAMPHYHEQYNYGYPHVWASNDLVNWVAPSTNPVGTSPPLGQDVDLFMGDEGQLCLSYISQVDLKLYVRTSLDGVSWSAPVALNGIGQAFATSGLAGAARAPRFLWDGEQYRLWYCVMANSAPGHVLTTRTCAILTGTWSAATPCPVSGLIAGKNVYHPSITQVIGGYLGVFFSTSIENPINDNGGVLQLGWSHDGITWILGANQLCKQQPIDLTVTGMYYYPEAGCLVPISPNSYWLVFSSQTAGQSVGVWEAFTLGRALVSYQDPAPLLSRLQLGTGVAPKASDGEMLDVNGDLSFPRTSSTGRRMLNWRTYPAGTYSYCIGCNNGDGRLYVGSEPGASAPRLIMGTIGGVYYCNFEATDPHFKGSKLWQTEGSNQTMGLATLTAGSVTIATNRVTANSRLYCTSQSGGANSGHLYVSARVAGTSFTVTSSNNADASTFAWLIIEPE